MTEKTHLDICSVPRDVPVKDCPVCRDTVPSSKTVARWTWTRVELEDLTHLGLISQHKTGEFVHFTDYDSREGELLAEVRTARRTAEFWKAEKLAADKVIDQLQARLALETAALETACATPIDQPLTVEAARGANETSEVNRLRSSLDAIAGYCETALKGNGGPAFEWIKRQADQGLGSPEETKEEQEVKRFNEVMKQPRPGKPERSHVINHAGDCESYCWCQMQPCTHPRGTDWTAPDGQTGFCPDCGEPFPEKASARPIPPGRMCNTHGNWNCSECCPPENGDEKHGA